MIGTVIRLVAAVLTVVVIFSLLKLPLWYCVTLGLIIWLFFEL